MASIVNEPNGRRRIDFIAPDRKRRKIRLGKVTQKQAESFCTKVETIISDTLVGRAHSDEVSIWLRDLDPKMLQRLERVKLIKPISRTNATLHAYLEDFFKSVVVKESTKTTYLQTKRCLTEYFDQSTQLRDIEPMQADKWRQNLKANGLAESTIARRVKCARQIFRRAMQWKLISENPFADVKAGKQDNKSRQFFVTQEMAAKVLSKCPDAEWRLIFALSRFGGLRCPSEHFALRWSDVDWDAGKIRVPSQKTEHLEGGESREIPLFPELRPYLLEAFELAEDGAEYVIGRYRDVAKNLRTQLRRIIERAGLVPWDKTFHNLRASRQTELAEKYPIHVVCAWLGNSPEVAKKHYLQLLQGHFDKASEMPSAPEMAKAAQIPAQQAPAHARNAPQKVAAVAQKPLELQGNSDFCATGPTIQVTPTGFEPVSRP